jgi:hypothetical protein
MPNRPSSTHVIAALLFLAACVFGAWSQARHAPQIALPRARFNDATPLGGKGLRLVLERLGYTVKRADGVLQSMPADARVWILLDPQTGFSTREADDLLKWINSGGTLVWAQSPLAAQIFNGGIPTLSQVAGNSGIVRLRSTLGIAQDQSFSSSAFNRNDEPLPPLSALKQSAPSEYWNGVGKASGSDGRLHIKRAHLEIAGSPVDTQLAAIPYGKGHVFVAPDALLFTNYALSKPDNAVLVTNLIRAHVSSGTVYFDERQYGEDLQPQVKPNLLYYLWRPPLRYALLQLLVAALLIWAFFGRRLGAPVPLPDGGPVTRASQFAAAMGALFRKTNRPRAAASIIGEQFRRELTKRLGLSVADPDALIAERAAEATGYSARIIDRLLLQAKTPDDDEERVLADTQLMEKILRSLDQR